MERVRRLGPWLQAHRVTAPGQVSPPGVLSEPLVAQGVALAAGLLLIRTGLDLPWWGFVAVVIVLGVALRAAGALAVALAARRWARLASELPFPCWGVDALFSRPREAPVAVRVYLSEPERSAEFLALACAGGFQVLGSTGEQHELRWRLATWRLARALRRLGRTGIIHTVRLSVPAAPRPAGAAQADRLPSITSRA